MINWKKLKLIIFDFDLTLTCIHTSGCQNERHLDENNITRNISDYRFIKLLIPYLIEMDYTVMIASYADNNLQNKGYISGEQLIMKYLDVLFDKNRTFLNKDDIIGFYPTNELDGKNIHINKLMTRYNKTHPNNPINNPDQILLIDDQDSNIQLAKFAGYQTYKIKDTHGLNREEWFEYITPDIEACGMRDLVKEIFEKDSDSDYNSD